MSIEKKILAKKRVCKVTFNLPVSVAETARTASVVGQFNDWDPTRHPMKRTKDGEFSVTLELPGSKEYEFRYLVDETSWETDWEADSIKPTPWGDQYNSVIKT